jgi:hypothetical protein
MYINLYDIHPWSPFYYKILLKPWDVVDIKAYRSNPRTFRALLEVKVGKESRARTWFKWVKGVCVYNCISIYLSTYLSISIYLSISPSLFFICLSVYLSSCLPVCLFVYYLSIDLSIYLPIYLSAGRSVCLSTYLI